MKVWIHINGSQEGPYELESLPMDRIDASTPVWYQGLADWMPASEAPLTAPLFGIKAADTSQKASEEYTYGASLRQSQAAAEAVGEQAGKCPSTYLGWSIALTILCFNPIGIATIITGLATRSKFRNRDFDGAGRMSEITAWLFMITIVTSLISLPFTLLLS